MSINNRSVLPPSRGVLVHIPIELLDKLDDAARAMKTNRSALIRAALLKIANMGFVIELSNSGAKVQSRRRLWPW